MRFVSAVRIETSEGARKELEVWCAGGKLEEDGALHAEGLIETAGRGAGLPKGTVIGRANGNEYLFPPVPKSVKTTKELRPYIRNVKRQEDAEAVLRKSGSKLENYDDLLEAEEEKPLNPQKPSDPESATVGLEAPDASWSNTRLRKRLREMGGRDPGKNASTKQILAAMKRLAGGSPDEERADFNLPESQTEAESDKTAEDLGAGASGTEHGGIEGAAKA